MQRPRFMSRQSSERLRGFRPDDRGRQQKAADAGAMGAAHEIVRGRTDFVTLGSENGSTHYELPDSDVTVTVTYPYPYNGGTDFVEVLIEERSAPTDFLHVVGTGTNNRAVPSHEAESPDGASTWHIRKVSS